MTHSFFAVALLLASPIFAQPQPPVRIILVGDSTMAVNSGYGAGFCALFTPEVTCINMAKGGRSTKSYRAEGSWDQVMEKLKDKDAFQATYVLIQFGHNDQPGKPGRSTDLETEFPENLHGYVQDVRAAGAKPVLVTPLTRRIFKDGNLVNTLVAWADAAREVAVAEEVPVLELNAESAAAVEKMGTDEANTLAMAPPPANAANAQAPTATVERQGAAATKFDYTHLGEKGAAFFGRMVADELVRAIPDLKPYLKQ